MSWNYRIGFKKNPSGFDEYGVVEAYYEDGKVVGFTDFTSPYSENVEGLKWSLERMLEACDKEVFVILPNDVLKGDEDDSSTSD